MPGYHSPQLDVAVRLNTNESPEPPPPAFFGELAEAVGSLQANRYPDRQATELRQAISEHHGVQPDQVFCANGSNEVLQCLFLAYGGPG
ncbi:MAG: histidinol-phosphate transaminase, partial [Actinomycetota bacterium]|nr:histidinol-phosphate transaminase [Actinomycetota bacterium]